MRRLVLLASALLLCACETAEKKAPPPVKGHADNLSLGCYTVDLFDPYRLEFPKAGVRREDSKFLGAWKDAAWNGEWCHDLYITEVLPDGTVTLLDAYGPYLKQKREATVFKRRGTLKEGVLSFTSVGGASVSYQLSEDGDYLLGNRIDALGRYVITMARRDGVAMPPIPPKKPVRS